ncbi:hypothetical protein [Myroides sp. DF42-4-2]|uniref:hypothetical protein n=1 Tax=unclassified Myroides TaxID=2642485 RepID=UPI002578885C|nr:hypothetical protein [Myroides sp. DF42-4-2]
MIRFTILLLLLCGSVSCQQVKKQTSKDDHLDQTPTAQQKSNTFELYELSEMAVLMEQMHVDNKRIRDRILAGMSITDSMPSLHQRLLTAVMTDPTDRDLFFETQARAFIQVEEAFYADPNHQTKEKFNAIVEACLSCHQKKCGGPIPRIKKLLIP